MASKEVVYGEVSAELTRGGKARRTEEAGSEAPRVEVPAVVGPRAEVEVAVGATVGLPNYSAARFDVRLRLPCKPDVASVDAAYGAALAWATRKLDELKATVGA